MKNNFRFICSAIFLLTTSQTFAANYSLPANDQSLIGVIQYSYIDAEEPLPNIQQHYDVGYHAVARANPHLDLDRDLPSGAPLVIPTQHLLPNQPRRGIVINLPEMRMYYYPAGTSEVLTYPIGIGKIGKTIPITSTAITRKVKDPSWVPPADIREYNLKQGIVLPSVMPAGPDNPLGPYAIYMRIPTYLIHSTIFPESVGKRASFGCIRMYKSDIEEFFPTINGGESVVIINTPVKVGWQDERLYLEAHDPLEEHDSEFQASLPGMVHQVLDATKNQRSFVNWQELAFIAKDRDGVPHDIGMLVK